MPLSETQIDWLKTAQNRAGRFEKQAERDKVKSERLKGVIDKLDLDKQDIREAQQFEVKVARYGSFFKLPGASTKMPWNVQNPDKEVDTYADIKPSTSEIPGAVVDKLTATFEKILERQHEMQAATVRGPQGKDVRLFNDEDITRELWTPLVREGVIPSNIVPDRYSDFAQMFKGGSEIYEEKLAEHSQTASRFERELEILGAARDTVSFVSSIGSNAITFAHFGDEAQSLAEKREIVAKRSVVSSQKSDIAEDLRAKLNLPTDTADGNVVQSAKDVMNLQEGTTDPNVILNAKNFLKLPEGTTDADVIQYAKNLVNLPEGTTDATLIQNASDFSQLADKITTYNNLEKRDQELMSSFYGDFRELGEKRAWFTATTSLLDAGFAAGEKGIKFAEQQKKKKDIVLFAQDAASCVLDELKNALVATGKTREDTSEAGRDLAEKQAFATTAGFLDACMATNRLAEKIVIASSATNKKELKEAVYSIIGSVGDTLATICYGALQADAIVDSGLEDIEATLTDESKKHLFTEEELGNSDDPTELLGASIKSGFVLFTNLPEFYEAITHRDYKKLAGAIGASLAQMAGSAMTGPLMSMAKPELTLLDDDEKETLAGLSDEELMEKKLELTGSRFTRTAHESFKDSFADPAYLRSIAENIESVKDKMNLLAYDKKTSDQVTKKTTDALTKIEAEKSLAALDHFKKKMSNPKEKEAFLKKMEEDVEAETKALKQVIEDATPDSADDAAVQKSIDAIGKLIADIKASEMKYKLIESIAAGGIQVLVRVVPVTGLAESIRKLTFEAIALLKKAHEVEKWRQNVKLAKVSASPYYNALKERHSQASIQISQKTINTFLSLVGVASQAARLADATQASTGLAAAGSMAQALSDYGYKVHSRVRIAYGWKLYKDARANPSNRKLARKAINWNSTLSKCILAYGIVEERDAIAKQVARNCGLTPEVLANDRSVCAAVVKYFETMFSDDPVVLRRVPKVENWHPGVPDLTILSWIKFKTAATKKAYPLLHRDSAHTPQVDKPMKILHKLCKGDPLKYPELRDALMVQEDWKPAIFKYASEVGEALDTLDLALKNYKPVNAPVTNEKDQIWKEGEPHGGMLEIVDAMRAQTTLLKQEIEFDLNKHRS